METKSCECCGKQLPLSAFSMAYRNRCKPCVAKLARENRKEKRSSIDPSAAIVIKAVVILSESIATLIEALGMLSLNQERISNGNSPGYSEDYFFSSAQEVREKAESLRQ